MTKDIWEKKPTGTRFISEEDFNEWLAELKAEFDDLKADAEIVRKAVNFKYHKEFWEQVSDPGPQVIISKEYVDELLNKAKKWDKIDHIPQFECFKMSIEELRLVPLKHLEELNSRIRELRGHEFQLNRIKTLIYDAPARADPVPKSFLKKLRDAAGMEAEG